MKRIIALSSAAALAVGLWTTMPAAPNPAVLIFAPAAMGGVSTGWAAAAGLGAVLVGTALGAAANNRWYGYGGYAYPGYYGNGGYAYGPGYGYANPGYSYGGYAAFAAYRSGGYAADAPYGYGNAAYDGPVYGGPACPASLRPLLRDPSAGQPLLPQSSMGRWV
jgi:hypothetical protein